jgi:hypothetical protein
MKTPDSGAARPHGAQASPEVRVRPIGSGGGSGAEPSLGPVGIAVIGTGVAFILAGIAWPQAADTLLRMLLAALVLVLVVGKAYGAVLPARMTRKFYSPFDGAAGGRPRPDAPEALRKWTRELDAADDPRRAQQAGVPAAVRWCVTDEVSRRLAERHGLSLVDANDHPAIRALVSEPTWRLVRPSGAESTPRPDAGSSRVPLSRLERILDDLEKL